MNNFLLMLLACISFIGLAGCGSLLENRPCSLVITTAQDKDKIAYLKNWISENIDNQEILQAIGKRGVDMGSPEIKNLLNIDWKYLGWADRGISMHLIFVDFNRLEQDREDFLISNNIKSVSFSLGMRNSLIIKVSNSKTTAVFQAEEKPHKVTMINDTVSVYCADAR